MHTIRHIHTYIHTDIYIYIYIFIYFPFGVHILSNREIIWDMPNKNEKIFEKYKNILDILLEPRAMFKNAIF